MNLESLPVRIHKPDSSHCGEPVVVLSPSTRKGYYLAISLSQGDGTQLKEVHTSCLLRNRQSENLARRINRRIVK